MWREKYFHKVVFSGDLWRKKLKKCVGQEAGGSLTVEAAIIVPVVILCIFLMVNAGIELYVGTAELVQKQEMWEEFQPAQKFRRQELLRTILGLADDMGGDRIGSNI